MALSEGSEVTGNEEGEKEGIVAGFMRALSELSTADEEKAGDASDKAGT